MEQPKKHYHVCNKENSRIRKKNCDMAQLEIKTREMIWE